MNLLIRTHSGTVLGTSRNTDVENQEPTGDRSQDDPHPEVESSVHQSRNSIDSDPEEASHTYAIEDTKMAFFQQQTQKKIENWVFENFS